MRNVITLIEDEAWAKGLAEGMARGLAEGMARGLAEGLAKGLAEGHAETALRMSRALVTTLRILMDRRLLTCDAARIELQAMIDAGVLTREDGQEAISQFS